MEKGMRKWYKTTNIGDAIVTICALQNTENTFSFGWSCRNKKERTNNLKMAKRVSSGRAEKKPNNFSRIPSYLCKESLYFALKQIEDKLKEEEGLSLSPEKIIL
jgi:hypothetical protein